jgi:DNA-binding NarL/FixJ family response regulator
MSGRNISICHRSHLLSDCLAESLNTDGNLACQILMPEDVLATSPASFESATIDLLLLDATLADDLSLKVAERIKGRYPACKIMLLISGQAVERMFEFAQIGGHGYLFEGAGLADARVAIQALLDGQQYCSPQLVNALLSQVRRVDPSREASVQGGNLHLTSRQLEILELIACRQTENKQIARQLRISVYTVKNHVHNIIDKLGARNRHEAVQLARRRGLLVDDSAAFGDGGENRFAR